VKEPSREIPVMRKVDVVVVGGGSGGFGAAIAAARNGAETLLVERYGFLGGMVTGGLVPWIPIDKLVPVEAYGETRAIQAEGGKGGKRRNTAPPKPEHIRLRIPYCQL